MRPEHPSGRMKLVHPEFIPKKMDISKYKIMIWKTYLLFHIYVDTDKDRKIEI